MSDTRKKRMSMLDSLASAGVGSAPPSMMSSNRALRSARDAVDGHNVWELDPDQILDDRLDDRIVPGDLDELIQSIETNGQVVPILVRRDPKDANKYLLVYGRRRLMAVRASDKVTKVRALIASLDDDGATRAQAAENTARRDLSYIEKALYAAQLVDSGYGSQSEVAEVLSVTKSWMSMALALVRIVSPELIRLIGPAPGVGRPRWQAVSDEIDKRGREGLFDLARAAHDTPGDADPSVRAFEAVEKAMAPRKAPPPPRPLGEVTPVALRPRSLTIDGTKAGRIKRTKGGLALDLTDPGFADWLQDQAQDVITELHARYTAQREE
ncbi:plasmid partitioning protein RepB [Tropicibacter naphthalenivorans]|uniref:Nucleoid occlusion protein n=1 Tax=Tropicibacter naphthalenivorans TaxID=441103 RepID=A0A0P1GGT0_9RHOB|nr:plasmid partitioning protein RepB [Tropicibacter naphthalenivorans]CUH81104.1 Nucleoid occlusion protein [Tropicibacter naphthalenivorans]SMC97181.1 chromosome partitioning protein, ParB family [Tropicibacter naphthalenivorans]